MAKMLKIRGVQSVLGNLKKARKRVLTGVERGLYKGGLFLQRKSQKVTPRATGNLAGGAFTRSEGGIFSKPGVRVGYVAHYAVYVHENLDAKHKKGKIPKFLERPCRENKDEIIKIIADEARRI